MPPHRYNRRTGTRFLGFESLEDRLTPAAVTGLYISEINANPIFGDLNVDEYFSIRGTPNSTIPSGTYLTVVDGSPGAGTAGTIDSVFDLSNLQIGKNGFLVVDEAGSNYVLAPGVAELKGTTTAFGGLPGNRFQSASTLSNQFEFIFGPSTFLLINSKVKPIAGTNVDPAATGTLTGTATSWNIYDSVGWLGNFIGPRAGEIAYGRINFANTGGAAPLGTTPAGSTLVPSALNFGYVARMGESTGYAPTDWVAGLPNAPAGTFDFNIESSIFGFPTIPYVAGLQLAPIGSAPFVSSVSGTVYQDSNGNGVLDSGEPGLPGVTVTAVPTNSDTTQNKLGDSVTTTVDPDNYPNNTDITNAVPGVTLTNETHLGTAILHGSDVTASADNGYSTTGSNIIGQGGINWFDNGTRLRMDFYLPVQSISIDFIGTTITAQYGRLDIFSADGTLLQTYLSTGMLSGQSTTLTITRPTADIAYAEAYTDTTVGFDFGVLDNLRFTQPVGVYSAVSGSDGNYNITGLQNGTYTVSETKPVGFLQTDPAAPSYYTPVIFNNAPVGNLIFGNSPSATGGTSSLGTLLAVGGTDGQAVIFSPGSDGQYVTSTGQTLPILPTLIPFKGDIRVVTGDVTGNGVEDYIVATGPGTPTRFVVIDGTDGNTLIVPPTSPFPGSESFTGGAFVSVGDILGNGKVEMVFTPDQGGGPRVTIFGYSVNNGLQLLQNFYGISDPGFRGGARSAVGDVNGDGKADLLVAAGDGGGSRVALYDGATIFTNPTKLINDFFVFGNVTRTGVFAAIGDVNGDGFGDLIFGAGAGGGPQVIIIDGRTLLTNGSAAAFASPIANFYVGGSDSNRGGVRVAAINADGDKYADVAVGSGDGEAADVKVYAGKSFIGNTAEPATDQDITPFNGAVLTDGVYVG